MRNAATSLMISKAKAAGLKVSRCIGETNEKRSNRVSERASFRSRLKLSALTRGPFAPITVTIPVLENEYDGYSTIPRAIQISPLSSTSDDLLTQRDNFEFTPALAVVSCSVLSELRSEVTVKEARDGATYDPGVASSSTSTFTAYLMNEPMLDDAIDIVAVEEEAVPTFEKTSNYPLPIDSVEYASSAIYESVKNYYIAEIELTVNKTPSIPKAAVWCQQDQAAGNDVSHAQTGIDRSANGTHHLQQQHDTVDHDISPYRSSNRRPYVRIPLDSCSIYTWNFLSVTTFSAGGAESDTDSVPSITVVCSMEQADFPPLADGCSLLHGSVVHFLPHNQTFTEPIFVSIEIPSTVPTSRLSSLSVYYSPTSPDERPIWRPFRSNVQTVDGGALRFEEEQRTMSGDLHSRARNAALVSTERREVLLYLRHFCLFAIVVDGREEMVQTASVICFLKIPPNGSTIPFVDVLFVIGCNKTSMADNERWAINDQGYTRVQNETIHIYESGGKIQVSLDSVDCIDKPHLSGQHPMVLRKIEVWNESTKTQLRIRPPAAHVEQNGFDRYFFATFTIKQDGKEPVTVTIEKDLHKLMPQNSESLQAPRLPFGRCQNCLQPVSNSNSHHEGKPVAEVAIERMIPQNQRDRNQGAAAAADANTSSTNDDNTNEMTSFQISLRTVHPSLDNESQGQNCQQLPGNSSYMHRKAESVPEAAVGRMTSHYQPDQNPQAATAANASSTTGNTTDDSFQISLRSEHPSLDNEKAEVAAAHSPRNLTDSHLSSSEYAKATYIPTHHDSRLPKQNRQQMKDGVQQHQTMQQQKDKRGVDDEERCHLSVEETRPVARDGLQLRETLRNEFNWCS